MKTLIAGSNGMIGPAVTRPVTERGHKDISAKPASNSAPSPMNLARIQQMNAEISGSRIKDLDTSNLLSRAHFPHEPTTCRNIRVHGEKELAKFPNKAKQRQLPFNRIQMLELHLGVMNPSASWREQTAGASTRQRESPHFRSCNRTISGARISFR